MQTTYDNTTNTNAGGAAAQAGSVLGNGSVSDLFVKLLVAQIKNQNPLEPTDPAAFVGQLTQLSQMEALQNLATQGSNQVAAVASLQLMTLGAQVGSEVTVQTDQVQLGEEPVQVGFTLAGASDKTTLVVTGAAGQETRVELGTRAAGAVSTTLDAAQLGLAPGSYTLRVETSSKETPATQVTGTLTNVQIGSTGAAMLQVAGAGQVAATSITGFNGRPTATH